LSLARENGKRQVCRIGNPARERSMTSTAAIPGAMRPGLRLIRRLPLLALVLALAAAVLLALGPLGWRGGWWHFRIGFFYLMPGALYCGLAAIAVALAALVIGRRVNTARQIAIGVIALAIAVAVAYVPWHYSQMRGTYPSIHDITTDWENPPQFHAVLPLRQAEEANPVAYEGVKISDQQRRAYPDIAPLALDLAPAEGFTRALRTAEQLGWTIVATDPETGRIEASQRSRWFGFTDDIVIRVAAAESGSRVDIRSVSRMGRGDFGVNATRIRAYLTALRAASQSR
jgi:uncharacterized protein (DUF1499 family)